MALVCSCHGVNTRQIEEEIARGATNIDELGVACAAGTCCQGCHPTLEAMLEQHAAECAGASRVERGRRRRVRIAAA